MIRENLKRVRDRIDAATRRSGRAIDSVRLIAVTKEADIDMMRSAVDSGVTDVGENRVKDALSKKAYLDSHILAWHMIGHLQTNKVREAVKVFSMIHSVDSLKLAYTIDKESGKDDKVQDFLIQVNVSGEASKFGIDPDGLGGFVREARDLKNARVMGLMTMAPFSEDPEAARPHFRRLKQLADQCGLNELSMGMTQDFEVAIEEGATMVRIGSAIFKE